MLPPEPKNIFNQLASNLFFNHFEVQQVKSFMRPKRQCGLLFWGLCQGDQPLPSIFFSLVIVEEASSRMLEKAKKDGLNNELHIEISKIKVTQLKFADDISYSSIQVESLKIILQAIVWTDLSAENWFHRVNYWTSIHCSWVESLQYTFEYRPRISPSTNLGLLFCMGNYLSHFGTQL